MNRYTLEATYHPKSYLKRDQKIPMKQKEQPLISVWWHGRTMVLHQPIHQERHVCPGCRCGLQKEHEFSRSLSLHCHFKPLFGREEGNGRPDQTLDSGGIEMTRDELNRELRMHSASWQAVALVYAALLGTLVLSAMAITA